MISRTRWAENDDFMFRPVLTADAELSIIRSMGEQRVAPGEYAPADEHCRFPTLRSQHCVPSRQKVKRPLPPSLPTPRPSLVSLVLYAPLSAHADMP